MLKIRSSKENKNKTSEVIKMKKEVIGGYGRPVVGIVACLHGDEKLGKHVIRRLKSIPLKKGTLEFIIANEEAMRRNERFIDDDLNRSFPGDEYGSYEERLAVDLREGLANYDYVIDIHSTTAKTEDFMITTGKDEETRRLASYVPLNKVVRMGPKITKGTSLIENVRCGISIEFDRRTEIQSAFGKVAACLTNLGSFAGIAEKTDQETYLAYNKMKKTEQNSKLELVNFRQTTIVRGFKYRVMGREISCPTLRETFYPILFGERAYLKKGILCFKARRE